MPTRTPIGLERGQPDPELGAALNPVRDRDRRGAGRRSTSRSPAPRPARRRPLARQNRSKRWGMSDRRRPWSSTSRSAALPSVRTATGPRRPDCGRSRCRRDHHQLPEPDRVALDHRRLGRLDADVLRPGGHRHRRRRGRAASPRSTPGGDARAGIRAREQQRVIDERGHPGDLGVGVVGRPADLAHRLVGGAAGTRRSRTTSAAFTARGWRDANSRWRRRARRWAAGDRGSGPAPAGRKTPEAYATRTTTAPPTSSSRSIASSVACSVVRSWMTG
jgi:hypothetical protein